MAVADGLASASEWQPHRNYHMMKSSNGNILRITAHVWIHPSSVNSPYKGQWWGALMFSLICIWINSWGNNPEAGDLRCYHAHYDVTVMVRKNLGNAIKIIHIHKIYHIFWALNWFVCSQCLGTYVTIRSYKSSNWNLRTQITLKLVLWAYWRFSARLQYLHC